MGTIYIIKNLINNHVYIGKTKRDYKLRWKEHIRAIKDKSKQHTLQYAIKKYGSDNFSFEVLESDIPDEQLNDKEKFYIEEYDSFHNGYNETIGGDGESHVDHELIIDLYNRGYTKSNIYSLTGYAIKTITSHINGDRNKITRQIRNHAIGYEINNGKKIKYNNKIFESHNDLAEYLSIHEPFFEGTKKVSIVNYISRHTNDGCFEINHATNRKKGGRESKGVVYDVNCREINYNGQHYKSYKELAIYLINNDSKFCGCRVNTVIEGISHSVKCKRPYKGHCFYRAKNAS